MESLTELLRIGKKTKEIVSMIVPPKEKLTGKETRAHDTIGNLLQQYETLDSLAETGHNISDETYLENTKVNLDYVARYLGLLIVNDEFRNAEINNSGELNIRLQSLRERANDIRIKEGKGSALRIYVESLESESLY